MTNNIQGNSHKSVDLSTETLQARREWHDIFIVLKRKYPQPWILYPTRVWFRFHGEIKGFPDKQKSREFSTTKPALAFLGRTSGQKQTTTTKNPTYQFRRPKRCEFNPWVGKIPWRRAWQPTPVFLTGEFHG